MSQTIAEQTIEIVSETFEIEGPTAGAQLTEEEEFARLHEILSSRIETLMEKNLERLMNILYRVDVDEATVASIFRSSPEDEIAGQLSELIIDRQKQKVITRNTYRTTGELPEPDNISPD